MYGKHFASMYTGSMFGAGAGAFAVMGYVIANAKDGMVELNPAMLAALLGMPKEDVERAIAYLSSPDPSSRNPDEEGRRIVREGQFMYRVPSYEIYRTIRNDDDRKSYMRTYMQDYRARKKHGSRGTERRKSLRKRGKPRLAHAEAEAEADSKNPPDPPANAGGNSPSRRRRRGAPEIPLATTSATAGPGTPAGDMASRALELIDDGELENPELLQILGTWRRTAPPGPDDRAFLERIARGEQ